MDSIGLPGVVFILVLVVFAVFRKSVLAYLAVMAGVFGVVFSQGVNEWFRIAAGIIGLWCILSLWKESNWRI